MHSITHVTISGLLVLLLSALVASPAAAQTAAVQQRHFRALGDAFHGDNPERGDALSLAV